MGIDFPLFFPFMEYQRMERDSTQYKTNLDFMRVYGILFHRIPCRKNDNLQPPVAEMEHPVGGPAPALLLG